MFIPGNAKLMVNLLSGQSLPEQSCRNDDLSHYLLHRAKAERRRWLPGRILDMWRARAATRRYEDNLVTLWEISPHLLDDIGVVLDVRGDLPKDAVPAPARVAERIAALRPAMPAPQPSPTPEVLPTPAPVAAAAPATTYPARPRRARAPRQTKAIGPMPATA